MSAHGSHAQITLFGAGLAESQQTEAGAHSGGYRSSAPRSAVTIGYEVAAASPASIGTGRIKRRPCSAAN